MSNGKGSRPRPSDGDKYRENFDNINWIAVRKVGDLDGYDGRYCFPYEKTTYIARAEYERWQKEGKEHNQ